MKTDELIGTIAAIAGMGAAIYAFVKSSAANSAPNTGISGIFQQGVTQGSLFGASGSGETVFQEQVRTGTPVNWTAGTGTIDYITSQTGTQATVSKQPDGTLKITTTGTGGNTGSLVVSDTGKGGEGAVSGADVYVGSTGKATDQEVADYGYQTIYRLAAKQGTAFQNMSENQRLVYVRQLGYDPLGLWVFNNGVWQHV